MTVLIAQGETDRLAYGFIQKTLDVTGGNLTTHLRKLEEAGYLVIEKGSRARSRARGSGRRRRGVALSPSISAILRRALGWQLLT